jgi:hypothetical protein
MSLVEIPQSTDIVEERTRPTSALLLAACFVGAFAAACALFLVIGHYSVQSPRSFWPFEEASEAAPHPNQAPFPETFTVGGPGLYKKALVGEKLNPTAGKDYAFFIWLKLRKVPAVGETLGLVGKFDSQVENRPGYAISLEGGLDGVKPRVYLSAASGGGRWYTFSPYPMSRKYWYLLAVSLSDDTFVSAHIVREGSSDQPTLLGGHRIGLSSLPQSASDIVVGAFGASRFRGVIGPFGVLIGKDLREDLSGYLSAIRDAPAGIPSEIETDTIGLWATPNKDIASQAFNVVNGSSVASGPSDTQAKKVWVDKRPKKSVAKKKKATSKVAPKAAKSGKAIKKQ